MTELPRFQLDRLFEAPRPLVWQAWTTPELLSRWYGPGVDTIIHQFDLKPGGIWLNEMKWGENSDRSKMEFREIVPEEKLVWLHSSTDADWNLAANPRMPDWPKQVLTTVTFQDQGAHTMTQLVWEPYNASEAERACFAGAVSGMGKGWGSGFAILDEILSELRNTAN